MSLTISEEKPEITKFLTTNQLGTLATADKEGQPHTAAVYFTIDPDLNIYFITKDQTTKARNIAENSKVAFAVYEAASQKTVQVQGTAAAIDDPSRADDIFRRILAITASTSESRIPPISKLSAGGYGLYKITPDVMRMASFTKPEHGQPNDIFDAVVKPDATL